MYIKILLLVISSVRNDTVFPLSLVGVAGIYTANKSWTVTGFGKFFIDGDNWRAQYALGYSNFNFQTYIDIPFIDKGLFLDYGSTAYYAAGIIQRRLIERLYLGLGFIYFNTKSEFQDPIPIQKLDKKTLQFGLVRDARDNVYYPKSGSKASLTYRYAPTWMGNTKASNIIILNMNGYIPTFNRRDVLAVRFHGKAGLNDI